MISAALGAAPRTRHCTGHGLLSERGEAGCSCLEARDDGFADGGDARTAASSFAGQSGFQTRFTGYEREEQRTTVVAVRPGQTYSRTDSGNPGDTLQTTITGKTVYVDVK